MVNKLHLANIDFEKELAGEVKDSLEISLRKNPIFKQLQYLPLLYMDLDDALLVTDPLPLKTKEFLQEKGIYQNQKIFTFQDDLPENYHLETWGDTPRMQALAEEKNLLYEAPLAITKKIQDKTAFFPKDAVILKTQKDLDDWLAKGPYPKILKRPFSVSGKGHYIMEKETPSPKIPFPLRGEIWHSRTLDFSSLWKFEAEPQFLGATLLINTKNGTYQKTRTEEKIPYLEKHKEEMVPYLETFQKLGYKGFLGIDAYVDQNGKLHLSEFNARKTMGYVAHAFQQKYFPGKVIEFSYEKKEGEYLPYDTTSRRLQVEMVENPLS